MGFADKNCCFVQDLPECSGTPENRQVNFMFNISKFPRAKAGHACRRGENRFPVPAPEPETGPARRVTGGKTVQEACVKSAGVFKIVIEFTVFSPSP